MFELKFVFYFFLINILIFSESNNFKGKGKNLIKADGVTKSSITSRKATNPSTKENLSKSEILNKNKDDKE